MKAIEQEETELTEMCSAYCSVATPVMLSTTPLVNASTAILKEMGVFIVSSNSQLRGCACHLKAS